LSQTLISHCMLVTGNRDQSTQRERERERENGERDVLRPTANVLYSGADKETEKRWATLILPLTRLPDTHVVCK